MTRTQTELQALLNARTIALNRAEEKVEEQAMLLKNRDKLIENLLKQNQELKNKLKMEE